MNKPYAVVFTYSFDSETPVYTFATEKEAIEFLRGSFKEEVRIDTEENGWDCESEIEPDGRYAKIINHFYEGDDITEFHLGQIYE